MLDTIYYGNSLKQWGISILIIIASFIVCKIFASLNERLVKKIASKRKHPYEGVCLKAIERPIMMAIILFAAWIALKRLTLPFAINHPYHILVVLNLTWFIARLITSLLEESIILTRQREGNNARFDTQLLPLIKRCINVIVWIIGGVMALKEAGVEVSTLLGTLGIGGIAFALAAQDTIKNILGGITIFIDHNFRIGDIILFDGIEGTVEDIGLRSTNIRTYDKRIVIIPNYKLTDAMITNISREHARRVVATLGLTYDTSYEQMQHALELLKAIPDSISDVEKRGLYAVFSEFGASALTITFIYFIRKPADIRETVSAVNFEILRSYNQSGLNFAFPTQTVFIENEKKMSLK
jgi:MscS family membrane protein